MGRKWIKAVGRSAVMRDQSLPMPYTSLRRSDGIVFDYQNQLPPDGVRFTHSFCKDRRERMITFPANLKLRIILFIARWTDFRIVSCACKLGTGSKRDTFKSTVSPLEPVRHLYLINCVPFRTGTAFIFI